MASKLTFTPMTECATIFWDDKTVLIGSAYITLTSVTDTTNPHGYRMVFAWHIESHGLRHASGEAKTRLTARSAVRRAIERMEKQFVADRFEEALRAKSAT